MQLNIIFRVRCIEVSIYCFDNLSYSLLFCRLFYQSGLSYNSAFDLSFEKLVPLPYNPHAGLMKVGPQWSENYAIKFNKELVKCLFFFIFVFRVHRIARKVDI